VINKVAYPLYFFKEAIPSAENQSDVVHGVMV